MKEKDTETSSPGSRYMSPLVKQDLARLDKDGESRRSAMSSLRHLVENLDQGSMPRFLAQVSDSRDQGQSRFYAVLLYVEVARVHGKLIIQHIPRIMVTVTKSLSSSGSSPQLHQACAKVVSAIAKYSIDDSSPLQADEIFRELCDPLLEVLTVKLEPLAAGAAICLRALVECENWKYASDEVVHEACLRATVALGEKITRTVAHMQLTSALATANPSSMSSYGVAILRAGVEVLRISAASSTWQQKACAARLLQVVLPTVDRATIASELGPTIQVLESCKHDRMPHVRSAVSEALKMAKPLLSEDNSRRSGDGEDPLGIPPLSFFSMDDRQFKRASRRKSLFAVSDDFTPTAPRRASCSHSCFSQESQIVSFTPSQSSESFTSTYVSPSPGRSRRSPLFPTRPHFKVCSSETTVNSADAFDGYFHSDRSSEAPAKENVPARNPDVNAGVPWEFGVSAGSGTPGSGRVGKYVRPRPVTPGSYIPYPPLFSDKTGTDQQSRDIDLSPVMMSKSRGGRSYNPLEESVITTSREQEGDLLAQEEEVFSSGDTTVDIEVESDASSSRSSLDSISNQGSPHSEQSTNSQIKAGRESIGSISSGSCRSQRVLNGPTMKNVFELKGPVSSSAVKSTSQSSRLAVDENVILPPQDFPSTNCKETLEALCNLGARYNSMAHLRSLEMDSYSPEKPKALITAEDFLPFSTPRRLVRSLQSNVSSPDSGSVGDQDVKSLEEDMADMDLETSSEAGWSVRDNPIASDDSFKSESDEDDRSVRKVCKKMTANGYPDNSSGQVGDDKLDTDVCEKTVGTVFSSTPGLDCDNSSFTSKDRAVTPDSPVDEVEIIKRTQQEGMSTSYTQSQGGLRSLLVEDGHLDCSSTEKESETCHSSDLGEVLQKDGQEIDLVSPPGLFRGRISGVLSSKVGDFFSKRWRNVRAYAEVFLGGSLLVVLALPLAMAMSKLFLVRSELPGLVPT